MMTTLFLSLVGPNASLLNLREEERLMRVMA